ncbi:MAG TPA: alpha-amylase family glycosyl hydrolase [Xanthobacteraceae bacterium]|jgi:alpha-glucosidase
MQKPTWWQTATIYQIYPRSFQDTNGDGVGDLRGITQRLRHLADLGIDAVWISPIFASPMADFGYDICDYTAVDPLFGRMEDFDRLLETAHGLGLKLLLDLVPNHTSDEHPWFKQSRSSRDNPMRDWYIWRDPAPDGGPPNNWLSEFGGSAWEYDQHTGQYYYHAFLAKQPDLNWRNTRVRHAMYDVMRFWLRKGVDGFRVDVIWHLLKDDQFRDNPPNPDYHGSMPPHRKVVPLYTADLPEVHGVVNSLRRVVDEFPERLLIGEIYLPIEKLVTYYGRDLEGTHLPFNFTLLETEWNARAIAKLIFDYEAALPKGGWPNWVLGNHDRPRIAGRVGEAQARIAAMLLLTLRGTPTVYYGDEIGMPQVPIPPERVQDPFEKNVPGIGVGRDGARTPMQWDASDFAGFSTTEPWLPLAADWHSDNVENQKNDATSMYNLYRRLIALRRNEKALLIGSYRPIVARGDLLLFVRERRTERILVALNLSSEAMAVTFPFEPIKGKVLVSALGDRDGEAIDGSIDLRADEGLVIDLDPDVTVPFSIG